MIGQKFISDIRSDWKNASELFRKNFSKAIEDDYSGYLVGSGVQKSVGALFSAAATAVCTYIGVSSSSPVADGIAVALLAVTAVVGRSALKNFSQAEEGLQDCSSGTCGLGGPRL